MITISAAPCSSIGDLVFNDLNRNGVQNTGQPGMGGITVKLLSEGGTVLATTTTGTNGAYVFSALTPGTYDIAFTAPTGFSATLSNAGTDDTKDSDPVGGVVKGIVLGANQVNRNVDAGFVSSVLQLGNRVWYDTNNDGLNNSGENGIANVSVKLYKDNNNDNAADGAAIATKTTDANGYYSFGNLAPGNYIVGVTIPAGYTSSSKNGGDPDNNINSDDNGQVLSGTEIRTLTITLAAGTEPDGNASNTNTNNTVDFGLLPDCNCINTSGNLLTNGNFESGTTGWTASGGAVTTGVGYIACGRKTGLIHHTEEHHWCTRT